MGERQANQHCPRLLYEKVWGNGHEADKQLFFFFFFLPLEGTKVATDWMEGGREVAPEPNWLGGKNDGMGKRERGCEEEHRAQVLSVLFCPSWPSCPFGKLTFFFIEQGFFLFCDWLFFFMFFLGGSFGISMIDDRSVRMAWLVVTDEILHESVREEERENDSRGGGERSRGVI